MRKENSVFPSLAVPKAAVAPKAAVVPDERAVPKAGEYTD